MKIRLLAIVVFIVLLSVLFCGCDHLDETNNQYSTDEVEKTYSSASDITEDSTASLAKEELTTESDDTTSGKQVIESTLETVNSTDSEADFEPSETYTINPTEHPQGEPEINFSDLM